MQQANSTPCIAPVVKRGLASCRYSKSRAILLAGSVLLTSPLHAEEKSSDWSVTLGAGAVNAPVYAGSATRKTLAIPYFNVAYKDTYTLSLDGLGMNLYQEGDVKLTAGISVDGIKRDDAGNANIRKLGNLNNIVRAKAALSYTLLGTVLTAGLATDVSNKNGGSQLSLSAKLPLYSNAQLTSFAAVGLGIADKKYMQSYFGVDQKQAALSGLNEYRPKAGIQHASLIFGANYMLDKDWLAIALVSVSSLQGDAARSPFTEKKTQASYIVGLARNF
ncbi:MAG: MipA/OmpV family protein [Pseudomonadota bacterium]